MSRVFVIAPCCSGKTTFVKNNPHWYDSDDAMLTQLGNAAQGELRALRRSGQWERHNQLWAPVLRAWAAGVPPTGSVVCHDSWEARQMGADPDRTFYVLPSLRTIANRLHGADNVGRPAPYAAVAALNWAQVANEVLNRNVLPFSSFEEFLKFWATRP